MRFLVAAFLLGHGIAHVVGFLGAWAPTRTTIVGNRIDLGTSWIKLVGLMWLAFALGFGAIAIATTLDAPWWPRAALSLGAGSLVLCLLQLPETKFGVALNLALIILLSAGTRGGWL
jgi:hypothetical protein